MSVKIRLSRLGRNKLPFYRIIVCDEDSKRDGRNLEVVGSYNTLTDPSTVVLKEDRVRYWVGVGATPTPTVATLINSKIPGWLKEIEEKRTAKVRQSRAKRKARAKSSGKPKAAKTAKSAKKAAKRKSAPTAAA